MLTFSVKLRSATATLDYLRKALYALLILTHCYRAFYIKIMIEVTSEFAYLISADYKVQKLIGTLCADGTRESFAEHHSYNDIGNRRLFAFDTQEELWKWEVNAL